MITIWLVVLISGVLTYAMRLSFIYLFGHVDVPVPMRRALRYVPSAIFSAIIVPALVAPAGSPDLSLHNYRLIAGSLAVLVAWRTKNTLLTLLAGMAALLILKFA